MNRIVQSVAIWVQRSCGQSQKKYSQQTPSYITIQNMVWRHILPVQHLCTDSPVLMHKILGLLHVAGLLLQGTFEHACRTQKSEAAAGLLWHTGKISDGEWRQKIFFDATISKADRYRITTKVIPESREVLPEDSWRFWRMGVQCTNN